MVATGNNIKEGALIDTPAPYQPYETATEEAVDVIRIWANELRERAPRVQRPDNFFAIADELDRAAELLQGLSKTLKP
jgi:hypothetical protein